MPLEIDLLTFDFTGCGLSDGDYITLGWKERDDLHAVLSFIESQKRFISIVIWGGGMGAATALMYRFEQELVPIRGLILDNCYA
jgi:pimeloyl-ACP methyl ester carboxylesterase